MINILVNNFTDLSNWELWVGTLIFSSFAYLVGSINGGQIYSRILNKDLGKEGSGNYGGTNAMRVHGKKIGIFVILIDVSKGLICSLIISLTSIYSEIPIFKEASVGFSLMFIVIGHIWPVYFKFKGGKGVAVSLAVLLVLNWPLTLVALGVFLIMSLITKRISIGSISGALVIISGSFFVDFIPENLVLLIAHDIGSVVSEIMISVLIIYKHIPNLKRIASGEDKGDKIIVDLHNKILRKK